MKTIKFAENLSTSKLLKVVVDLLRRQFGHDHHLV